MPQSFLHLPQFDIAVYIYFSGIALLSCMVVDSVNGFCPSLCLVRPCSTVHWDIFLSARHPAKALPVDGQKTLRLRRTANPIPVYEAFGYPPALLALRISCTDRNCRQRKYNNYMSTNAKHSKSNTFLSLLFSLFSHSSFFFISRSSLFPLPFCHSSPHPPFSPFVSVVHDHFFLTNLWKA